VIEAVEGGQPKVRCASRRGVDAILPSANIAARERIKEGRGARQREVLGGEDKCLDN